MAFRKIMLTYLFLVTIILSATAQERTDSTHGFAIEARVTTYIQGGFDLGAFYYPRRSKFSIGAIFATHDVTGGTKDLIFSSNNIDALDIRLAWLLSVLPRYHFSGHKEGFFAELGLGMEAFRVKAGNESRQRTNGFIAPSVGYIWYPWQRKGFYLLPKITGPIIINRGEEQLIQETVTYRLKSIFPSPSLAIGWKF